jgi:hypothetical protein
MLTTRPAFDIWKCIDSVQLTSQYVVLSCPVVARRAESEAETDT